MFLLVQRSEIWFFGLLSVLFSELFVLKYFSLLGHSSFLKKLFCILVLFKIFNFFFFFKLIIKKKNQYLLQNWINKNHKIFNIVTILLMYSLLCQSLRSVAYNIWFLILDLSLIWKCTWKSHILDTMRIFKQKIPNLGNHTHF